MRLGRNYYLLLAAEAAVNLADVLFTLTLIVLVNEATDSAFMTGMVPIVRVAAMFASGMIAPLVLRRYPLRSVLVGSVAGEILFMLLIASMVGSYAFESGIVPLLALLFGFAFFKGWAGPAKDAVLPRLVPESLLVKANGLMSTTDQTVMMAGWALGGIVIAWTGRSGSFWAAVAIMAAALAAVWFIRFADAEPSSGKDARDKSNWSTMKSGWSAIWNRPILRVVTTMDVTESIANGVWVAAVLLIYVEDVLGQGSDWFGFMNAAYFAGTISGGLLVMLFSRRIEGRLIPAMIAGSLAIAAMTVMFALTSSSPVALLLCLLMGPAFQMRDIAQRTIFQTRVKAEELASVYAAQGTLLSITFGVSVMIMGLVTDLFGVRATYLTAGGLFLLSGMLALRLRRTLPAEQA
ncbi:MFS transporter [Paenibacillus methanolicus]|uniref:Putative MFS family arabinose efflux permease n=1 Tax=Paenibacillus methanolicus TaxID=582686 RepID=A0A5S5CA58_9BACL|nr:MFS transporter [Paenibacillus methanolicus]TYP74873.1 putative MFS family arabinose efflux permease [Paenibacillus methanolicus]